METSTIRTLGRHMTPSHTDTTLYRCNSAIERYVIYRLGNYDSIRLCLVGIIVRNSFDFRSNLICCSPSLDISFIIQTHDLGCYNEYIDIKGSVKEGYLQT